MPTEVDLYGDKYTIDDTDARSIVTKWSNALMFGEKAKEDFLKDAKTSLDFYHGPHDFMYDEYNYYSEKTTVTNRITVNKTFEMIQIFEPALYFKAPKRIVRNTEVGDPAFAKVIEEYQEKTIAELDHRGEALTALRDGLLSGRGILWSGMDPKTDMAGSMRVAPRDILVDPDANTLHDVYWIARRHVEPLWKVKKKFNLDKNIKLPDNFYSTFTDTKNDTQHASRETEFRGKTKRLVQYWEIYSKMGIGTRLKMASGETRGDYNSDIEKDNDYFLIVIVPDYDFPLHIGTWPTPFWADTDHMGWPCSFLDFHPIPDKIWPMSHMKPAFGEQMFLNWAHSFLADKARIMSRNLVFTRADLKAEAMAGIRGDFGRDYTVVKLDAEDMEKSLDQIIKVINFADDAPMHLMNIIAMVEEAFEKRTGMTEILYGTTSKQLRSASEAQIKDANAKLRIDEMADMVEQWETEVSRKEAIVARFHVQPDKIALALGPEAAEVWGQYQTGDVERIVREYTYKIEAGSTQRPNIELMKDQAAALWDRFSQVLLGTESYEAMNNLIMDYCKANQVDDPERFTIPLAMFNGMVIPQNQYVQLLMQQQMAMQAGAEQPAAS